jgi:hypothetical protein
MKKNIIKPINCKLSKTMKEHIEMKEHIDKMFFKYATKMLMIPKKYFN